MLYTEILGTHTSIRTRRSSRLRSCSRRSPYRGVRGTGVAHLLTENVESTLRNLIERYQGTERSDLSEWLLSRIESEVAIHIEPRTISSWDFSHRMKTSD